MTKPTKWHVCPAKTQISLGIRPVWSETSLSTWRKLGSLATNWAHREHSDQTGWIPRLIWVFAGCTYYFVGFVMRRLIYGPANYCNDSKFIGQTGLSKQWWPWTDCSWKNDPDQTAPERMTLIRLLLKEWPWSDCSWKNDPDQTAPEGTTLIRLLLKEWPWSDCSWKNDSDQTAPEGMTLTRLLLKEWPWSDCSWRNDPDQTAPERAVWSGLHCLPLRLHLLDVLLYGKTTVDQIVG